jgi:hypothetical protein
LIIASILVIVGGFGIYIFFVSRTPTVVPVTPVLQALKKNVSVHTVIGTSVQGRSIDAYTYGTGNTHIVLVGGIHGGYEWNSVVVAYGVMDYLEAHPDVVPTDISVTVIPSANPDGVFKVIGKEGRFTNSDVPVGISTVPGRFNANNVDLNRNFDCKWQPKSTWQNKTVSAGSAAFSEPEALAIKNLMLEQRPVVAVFWHSQSGAVYASQCEDGILAGTLDSMNVYAHGSGYPAVKTFTAYETTGGADDWVASIGIPAFSVELTTHESIELEKNIAGVRALLDHYK